MSKDGRRWPTAHNDLSDVSAGGEHVLALSTGHEESDGCTGSGALMWALLILFVGLACLSWLAMANAATEGASPPPDCAKVPCKPTAEGAATETNA
eukprot:CAMPEP_0177354204 /NCGR_PEP_ID=MMETSP0368-20130122/33294_1 /TAXON_ID=447022 ORGANISM="Scrippsiella hangoei-like, Strain SHHI-4" /NCGR_SAMPLE_ID=MMETSP0368 /ASSEMBLY_ACC=CAM_ASM_000363 /LENGTH=95 /DNA_ID=CAMNT_0018816307 /DNA_START=274 /DNA_END=563 /DNA_ORIENTATION=-